MRVGSIIYSDAGVLAAVVAQDGAGLKVKNICDGTEGTLLPGTFHRLRDSQFEFTLRKAFNIEVGEPLPNPNKPVYQVTEYTHSADEPVSEFDDEDPEEEEDQ